MIITRTPFRLSLDGGGTDLPSYYAKKEGFFVSGAVDKYVHIALNPRFEGDSIRVSYSVTEIVDDSGKPKHPLVRAEETMTEFDDAWKEFESQEPRGSAREDEVGSGNP
jgi:D-glycero-alpha-D-manno-heptose-7-phosphate kinase